MGLLQKVLATSHPRILTFLTDVLFILADSTAGQ